MLLSKIREKLETDEKLKEDIDVHLSEISEQIMLKLQKMIWQLGSQSSDVDGDLHTKLEVL